MLAQQDLQVILQEWSFWDNQQIPGLTREWDLPERLHTDLVLIIQGVRRCGKSTLLTQLPARYQLDLADCYYCNFEDPRLLGALDHTLLSQIVVFARQNTPADRACYFFFDEIQNVQDWEKWIHTQLERPKNNYFVVTGSNACLLSGEFGTTLTGRHITIELFPFSFVEYQKLLPGKKFEDYLNIGGFPRALTFEKPYQLLQEYFQDIILRDVVKRVHARAPEAIKQVVKMAFDSCGIELSYRKIGVATDLNVDTVKSYLEACEQAYLLFACVFFDFSEKKRALKQKKYYPVDLGLRYAITGTQGRDLGKSLEQLVFLKLKQVYHQVFYWQQLHQGEVDFVVMQGQQIIPYQVSWTGPAARHERALENFYKAYPQASEAVFIARDNIELFLAGELF